MNKHKKKLLCIISFAVIISFSFACTKSVRADENFRVAKIKSFSGKVQIGKGGGEKTFDAIEGMSLVEGDSITTEKDSSALLYIDDDKEVKIGDNSMVNLSELSGYIGADEEKTGISLWVGKIFSNIKKKLKLRSKYEIKVPTAVMGVRGTEFYVLSLANGDFEVAVLEGTVVGIRNLTQDEENYNTYEVTITKNQMASLNQNDKTQSDTIITEIKINEATLFALEVLKDYIDRNPESVDENTKMEINNEIEKRRSEELAIGTNNEAGSDAEKPVIKIDPVVEENMSLNNVVTLANLEEQNVQPEGEQENQFFQATLNGAAEAGTESTAPAPQETLRQPQEQVQTQPTADQGTNPQENTKPVPEPATEQGTPPAQEPTRTRTEDTTVSGSGGGGGARQTQPQQELPQVQPTMQIPQASSGWISNVTKTGVERNVISFTAQDFNSQLTNIQSNSLSGIKIKSLPSNGTLMIDGSLVVVNQEIRVTDLGRLTFKPDENWSGTTSFNWVGSNGISYESNESTVIVTVTPGANVNVTTESAVNIRPKVNDLNLTTLEDEEITGKLTVDGGNTNGILIYSVASHPTNGELVIDEDGSYRYIPNRNYNGNDSFKFKVNNGTVDSNEATVSITITSVNDAPIVEEYGIVTNYTSMAAVTINASDPDGDTLSYAITEQPMYGDVVLVNSATGEFEYRLVQQFSGTDSFVVTVSDGKGGSAISNVIVVTDLQSFKSLLNSIMGDIVGWASQIVVGTDAGDCSSQQAIDELNAVITNAQNIVSKPDATVNEINGAINTLKVAREQVENNIVNTLEVTTSAVVSVNPNFDTIIEVQPSRGTFSNNLSSSNVTLGKDFAGLTIKSVSVSQDLYRAQIELSGNLSYTTGIGTITVNADGLESTVNSKDITASIVVNP